VEARGDVVTVLNKGDITATAQVYAFGVVALGDETTVRNDGPITATSNYGNAYGELAIGNTKAITTNAATSSPPRTTAAPTAPSAPRTTWIRPTMARSSPTAWTTPSAWPAMATTTRS
jgi:hypothetical protein